MPNVAQYLLSLIGLTSPIILFIFLDKYLRNDLKIKVADSVYGSIDTPLSVRISLLHETIYRALGNSYTTRILRLSIISAISIMFIYTVQYYLNNDEFTKNLEYTKQSTKYNFTFAFLVIISFITVDVISFLQTLTFMRLTAYCKNFFEIAFLAFADIIISLIMVIVFMPLLIFITHKLTTSPRENIYYLSMTNGTQRQDLSIYDVIRMTAPWVTETNQESQQDSTDTMESYNSSGWYYANPSISASDSTSAPDLQTAAAGLEYNLGRTLYLTKNSHDAAEEAKTLSKILTSHKHIEGAEVVNSERDMFGNQVILFRIHGRTTYSNLRLFSDYTAIMNDINYFGNDFSKFIKFSNKLYSENELKYLALFNGLEKQFGETMYFMCNGDKLVQDNHNFLISIKNKGCETGVAMSKNMLEGIASIASYKFSNSVQIPILPTSLSSIFLTAFIYICSLSWITLPYIRKFINMYAQDGDAIVTRHVFTITFSILLIIASPFLFLYKYYS
ncbi:hypothetical protein [Parasphingorhabdus sp.]|uniref:hypothetical protein n=1 Tax=Parasphingorhabdus sp. TaxID=2709688 RepID=UPI0032971AEB